MERRVPNSEHAITGTRRVVPDWEAVRVSLEVVRRGSFRAAAEQMQMSVNALRRRVDELEKTLGVKLLTRHVDGVRITAEGEKVFAVASRMETASFDLLQAHDQTNSSISGEVRLAVTEGLGTFWIAPRLVEFQRANPNLLIDVNCAMKSADVLRLEADVAIQITRPTAPDLRMVKLGRLHLMPFAAPSYLETFGTPKSAQDLVRHRILVQSDDNVQWRDLYDRLFPGISPTAIVALRTNVSSAHYWSIAKGAGIGLLPTYAQWIGAPIVPLDLGIHETVDIWLTYHPDVKRIPRVSRLIDWTIQAFSPQKYPWFRDEFIHANELKNSYRHEPLPTMFSASSAA
ncbi:MAG TPA: LysR family transcriptional regulator [Micropepsaceae bacterium]|nr:LysR family transcriptional regulator [Micropepsaceae bacterium]